VHYKDLYCTIPYRSLVLDPPTSGRYAVKLSNCSYFWASNEEWKFVDFGLLFARGSQDDFRKICQPWASNIHTRQRLALGSGFNSPKLFFAIFVLFSN